MRMFTYWLLILFAICLAGFAAKLGPIHPPSPTADLSATLLMISAFLGLTGIVGFLSRWES